MALSSSSSAVRSPEIARRISGPMSWSVRSPACRTANYRASYLRVGTGETAALPLLPKHCGAPLVSTAPQLLEEHQQTLFFHLHLKPRNVCCSSLASSQQDIDINPQAWLSRSVCFQLWVLRSTTRISRAATVPAEPCTLVPWKISFSWQLKYGFNN